MCGPFDKGLKAGAKDFVTFIGEATRWTTGSVMAQKSEIFSFFSKFLKYAERKTGREVQGL